MAILYNIGIRFYLLFIWLASFFNHKANQWVVGRKNLFERLADNLHDKKPLIWFHAASLGEFEQGRPVIEAFRKAYPNYFILLTFFSPSGYEIRKDYDGVDYISYLPIDTPGNAKRFIELINPAIAIFIKYEFWFNYLNQLHRKYIPLLIISANFRTDQYFFKWYGSWFRNQLKHVNHFFVQNEASKKLLLSIGINHVHVSGDTRFDRVASIAKAQKENSIVAAFTQDQAVILGGSTWPQDEKLLAGYFNNTDQSIKLIIAPHEIHEDHIKSIETLFPIGQTLRYSRANTDNVVNSKVLIIDGIGFLSGLYSYCRIAYIGGGFGKGIHNILEAVTFGKPVVFGPEYKKFGEAVALLHKGGAFTFSESNQLEEQLHQLLTNEVLYQNASKICKTYIGYNMGATVLILDAIHKLIK